MDTSRSTTLCVPWTTRQHSSLSNHMQLAQVRTARYERHKIKAQECPAQAVGFSSYGAACYSIVLEARHTALHLLTHCLASSISDFWATSTPGRIRPFKGGVAIYNSGHSQDGKRQWVHNGMMMMMVTYVCQNGAFTARAWEESRRSLSYREQAGEED